MKIKVIRNITRSLKATRLKLIVVFGALLAGGCGSDSDPASGVTDRFTSTRVVAINGRDIPDSATLRLIWILPDDRDWDSFVTDGGELTTGQFEIRLPQTPPTEVISEVYGVATAFIVAFPNDDMTPIGPIGEEVSLDTVTGITSQHMVIYRPPDFELPTFLQGFDWWVERFPIGFSCGQAFETTDFDIFEPVECSDVELTIGPLDEINIIGGDWY